MTGIMAARDGDVGGLEMALNIVCGDWCSEFRRQTMKVAVRRDETASLENTPVTVTTTVGICKSQLHNVPTVP